MRSKDRDTVIDDLTCTCRILEQQIKEGKSGSLYNPEYARHTNPRAGINGVRGIPERDHDVIGLCGET